MSASLVGSEMCIRDSVRAGVRLSDLLARLRQVVYCGAAVHPVLHMAGDRAAFPRVLGRNPTQDRSAQRRRVHCRIRRE
eukprot:2319542-Alexandrium_andersonii.AAC.1